MVNLNDAFIEELYYEYLKDPDSVSNEWRDYFGKQNSELPPIAVKSIQAQTISQNKSNEKIQLRPNEIAEPLMSIASKISDNMEESLSIPTATSVRTIPVKALDENRRVINKYLTKMKRKKISFTHILAWALVKTLKKYPALNDSFALIDGKPHRIKKSAINIGLAVDLTKKDGSRLLLVPNIKSADKLQFKQFIDEYDRLIDKARNNKLDIDDLQDTTLTLTNPGMIGTTHSNPRLMKGQGLIVATGSIDYPTEFQAVKPEALTDLAVSKVVTITSTYDHRIIQGAESAEFLAYVNRLLLGYDNFYDQIFVSLGIPFEPIRWETDVANKIVYHSEIEEKVEKGAHVMQMINAFRVRGHLLASVNPLGMASYYYPELDPAFYGFTIWDLDRVFHAEDVWEKNNLPLREIIEKLRESYCGAIGYEFMHIQDPDKKNWIKEKIEISKKFVDLSKDDKIRIYKKLTEAEQFENYLHTKFVGHKRFSLEGGESVIVMLDEMFQIAADEKLNSIVLGMAHRGRLNVLVNVMGKKPEAIFNEFDGDFDADNYQGSGDVKYHLGEKSVFESAKGNKINVILSPNPSHLELVDPVIVGIARAIDNQIQDDSYSQALPIIIHGDAAFAGQGIVAETLNLSQLDGYKTGGTIHIVINNQIGFTTFVEFSRSTVYATDIAKMIQTPILHVNGNDPEAVCNAAAFAMEYRNKFGSDVIIDMLCYRKYGHNESDEPTYTQPLLYKKIKSLPQVSSIYEKYLQDEGILNKELKSQLFEEFKSRLDNSFTIRKEKKNDKKFVNYVKAGKTLTPYFTAIPDGEIRRITHALTELPEWFKANPKVLSLLKKRREMVESDQSAIDWAMGEALSIGSILLEGRQVRLTGQDSRRGTFSQRHAVLTDVVSEEIYIPLNNIDKDQGRLRIWDSPLSEVAVMGFEFGYSTIATNDLTLWEAQFGDFANNAQTMIDQFISCSEVKWGQTSSLVLLLPHSYDGQGPEHSSARLERYLQMCAEENMIVCNLTTPAQYFHVLRRQLFMTNKMPLIIMTPKSMLRHPQAVSPIDEFTHGEFQHLIDDSIVDKNSVTRILMCTGKIYYELLEEREKQQKFDTAIVRLEQIYPFHEDLFQKIIASYPNAKEFVWVQEEPKNMGSFYFLMPILLKQLMNKLSVYYVGRKEGAATATGSFKRHLEEQSNILKSSFDSILYDKLI